MLRDTTTTTISPSLHFQASLLARWHALKGPRRWDQACHTPCWYMPWDIHMDKISKHPGQLYPTKRPKLRCFRKFKGIFSTGGQKKSTTPRIRDMDVVQHLGFEHVCPSTVWSGHSTWPFNDALCACFWKREESTQRTNTLNFTTKQSKPISCVCPFST